MLPAPSSEEDHMHNDKQLNHFVTVLALKGENIFRLRHSFGTPGVSGKTLPVGKDGPLVSGDVGVGKDL